ncbi:PrsW family glutamic-type intramembrane protease [Anaerotignum faecicola]|nr:PrsW family glutamic-type intramembrane protease [Anaerotignum faecicola]
MLLSLAVAPVIIFLVFMFIKDRYEKEPLRLLLLGALYGFYISVPVLLNDVFLMKLSVSRAYPIIFSAFVTSAGNEELLKLVFLYFLMYKNKELNEPVDGIVYSVFISLGFAGAENIIYIFNPVLGGFETALSRAVISVPAHGLFAVSMGYYFGIYHYLKGGIFYLFAAFFSPWILHGLFNFILLWETKWYLFVFIPYVILLWVNAFIKIKSHLGLSPFKKA